MPNISDSLQCRNFLKMLTKCEDESRQLNQGEDRFVAQMRESFEAREDQIDLGITPWNPTVSQWNWLSDIYDRVKK